MTHSAELAHHFDVHADTCPTCSSPRIGLCEEGRPLFEAWSDEFIAEHQRRALARARQSYYRPAVPARPRKRGAA